MATSLTKAASFRAGGIDGLRIAAFKSDAPIVIYESCHTWCGAGNHLGECVTVMVLGETSKGMSFTL